MSAAIVQQALEIVDPESGILKKGKNGNKKVKKIFDFLPENHKLIVKNSGPFRKGYKQNLLSSSNKLTVSEARRIYKSKDQIFQENIKKLKLIRELTTVELDSKVTDKIIERAVTKRPIGSKQKTKEDKETIFTEEDFKKFEEEYFDDGPI